MRYAPDSYELMKGCDWLPSVVKKMLSANLLASKDVALRLWSHCIRIWPIFYSDIHGRQRQNKQMRLSKWRRSQWRRAALTCTEMFHRLTVETKSFYFFPAVYASVSFSFVLSTSMPCFRFFILEENG